MSTLTPASVLKTILEDSVVKTRKFNHATLSALAGAGAMRSIKDDTIRWVANVGGQSTSWESINNDGAGDATGITVPAELRIAQFRLKHQFLVNRISQSVAAQRAPEDLKDIYSSHLEDGMDKIGEDLNKAIFLANGTAAYGNMVGLQQVIDNTAPYAGISPTVYPTWRAIVNSAGTPRPLTKNLLLEFEQQVREGKQTFNMIVTSPAMGTTYNKLFDSIGGALNGVQGENGLNRPELGHAGRTYMNIPILEDADCPAGVMYFIDTTAVNLYSFDVTNLPVDFDLAEKRLSSATAKVYGLNVNIAELQTQNPLTRKFEMYVLPQLRVRERAKVQAITNLQ